MLAKNLVRSALSFAALAGLALILSNCSASDSAKLATTSVEPKFDSIYTNIIQKSNCVNCHQNGGAASTQTGVDFTSKTSAYNTMYQIGVQGSSASACGTMKIIKAGDSQHSYFMGALAPTYAHTNFGGVAGCNPVAHYNTYANLSMAEVSALETWINNGALNN